ncbi:hypothetical protein ACMHYP_22890 [Bacillus cereus]|uniref:hypothetical protein n=1 Tax=Bacillus cereus group TaxID=86661 RepID=UPI0011C84CE7|nr:hypothetical protein [Bacillus sp. AR18-7]TXR64546.1 hypothetical protein DN395_11465 [Bacillus sp. AR18-7]
MYLLGTADNFNVEYFNKYIEYQQENGKNADLASGILNSAHDIIPLAVNITFYVLMIIFAVSAITLAGALTTKNTQWMKTAVGGLLGTFIAVLALRLAPLLFITNDIEGIALLMRDCVDFLTTIGIYVAVGMFVYGLFLGLLYKLFEHPKYFKWSRSLRIGSIVTLFLSVISPVIIGNI